MNKINVNMTISFSKLIAFMILCLGSVFSFISKDSTVLMTTFSTVMVILGFKQYQDRIKEIKTHKEE